MNKRIVLIGAGSSNFGLGTIGDIFKQEWVTPFSPHELLAFIHRISPILGELGFPMIDFFCVKMVTFRKLSLDCRWIFLQKVMVTK